MKLFLAVPRQSSQTSPKTVASPARTREWMTRLPLLNSRESLQQIHDSLHGINRTTLRTTQRLRLLDMHRSPLRVIRGQVESRLSKGAAPLSQSDLQVAGLFRDCCVEMAFGYKIIVLEIAQSRKLRQLDEMKLSLARALFYLEQTVFVCALFRQSSPEGIWLEMHTIYNYARTLGVAEDSLKDPVTKARSSTSISLTYRRALLFSLSDPFHQSVPLMGRVLDFLRQHALNAQIDKHARTTSKGHCQFVIDPQSDYPARAYSSSDNQKPPKNALFLDTANLTRNARQLLERLQSAEQVDIEFGDEFQDELGSQLLEEVVYKWGLTITRNEDRVDADHARVEVMIGIEAANYCINKEEPFTPSTLDHVNIKQNAIEGVIPEHEPYRRRPDLDTLSCRMLDRGASGFRLTVSYDIPAAGCLRVGDVITCRGDSGPWTPGLIRWMRCIDDSIHFGVRTLPDAPRPVGVKPVSTGREDPFKTGLAVYPGGVDTGVLQLITFPGLYRHQRNLLVDDGHSLHMTRAEKLIESSQTMEWFECETFNI